MAYTPEQYANEGIPEPYLFDQWDEWATALVNAVNRRVE